MRSPHTQRRTGPPHRLFATILLICLLQIGSVHAEPAALLQLQSARSSSGIADCLRQGMRQLQIPDDYIQSEDGPDGKLSLQLHNPHSGNRGLKMEISTQGDYRLLRVDPNGITLTAPWLRMIRRCIN